LNAGFQVKVQVGNDSEEVLDLYSEYHALVIGIGEYRYGWSDLPNAVEDAQVVATMLRDFGWQVDFIKNPNGHDLNLKLNELIVETVQDRNKGILVWFSGHGHTEERADGTPLGYLVPSDAPNPKDDLRGFMATAINMDRILSVSGQIRAKHVLMMFDSCFSGTLFASTRSANPSLHIQRKVAEPVRQFITAGQADEKVPDDSFFHKAFLTAIQHREADLNGDTYITGTELGSYLSEKVTNYSEGSQNPAFGKIRNPSLDKGDFVFVLTEPSPRTESSATTRSREPDIRVIELEVWREIRTTEDPGLYQQFLRQFPNGIFSGLARHRLALLTAPQALTQEQKEKNAEAEKRIPAAEVQRQKDQKDASAAFSRVAWAIKEQVEKNWSEPGDFSGLSVAFLVKVDRQGNVLSVKMTRSSGNARLDESAENAIFKASPLPFPGEARFYEYLKEFNFVFKPES